MPMGEEQSVGEPGLEKVLSYPVILLITINSIMGTGIFFLPAVGAGLAGPASLISWVILSFISVYIAMCFGELCSMFPTAGGIYEYCKQAYGYFWSFIIGWTTMLAGNITIAMLIVGAIQYIVPANVPLIKIPICLFFIFLFNYIAFKGMQTSAMMLVTFAGITLITVFGLAAPGFLGFNVENFTPFFVKPIPFLFIAIFFIAETFFGWETATFLAGETKDGARVMPKALIWGTVIIAVIVLISVFTSLSAINWEIFGSSTEPLSDLAAVHYGGTGKIIFSLLVYLAIIGSVAGWIVSAPRLLLAMAEDKLFLKQLAKIHPVNKTPHNAILFQTIFTTILVIVGSGSYSTLLHLLVPLVLLVYSAVLISLLVLRKKEKERIRHFTTPFAWVGVPLVVLFLFGLIVGWLLYTAHAVQLALFALSLVFLGIPVFLLLKVYYDPEIIIKLEGSIAPLSFIFDRFFITQNVKAEIFNLLDTEGDGGKGQTVFEYGCNVGTLTEDIARFVGEHGKVFATASSIKALRVAKWRLKKQNIENVTLVYDEHQVNRIHPELPKVHGVVSMGMLGFVQDIKKVLLEIHAILPEDGKICFCDYVDFFHILPNVSWLSQEETIREIFSECGFRVLVKKERRLFWNYLYVYGIKAEEDVPFA